MSKKVKWGVLGTAGIAAGCTIPGMMKTESCGLYAIAGRSFEKALSFKERFGFEKAYSGYDALLADPEVEAVYIPLPNDIHCEWVIKALNARKHVLCEKPIAMNEAELRKMFAAAKENGVILMEAFAYLHSPYIAKLQSIIESGEIGKVDYIDTAFVTQGYTEDFRLHKEQGGGGIYDVGCYCTSMILSLIDSPVKYVKADAELDASGVDHLASAMIGFENGSRATFNAGMILGADTCDRYDRMFIHGSKGYIRSDTEYNGEGELSLTVTVKNEKGERISRTETVTAGSNYALELENMNECITNGAKPHISEEFSEKNMRLLDSILDAAGYNNT
ncbi:MAG: Gfo/Idh/MocA family oxidoreductase [Ruminococcus sp.]|nr:Gfo/Idh/MocA family oxidoreductase [Ruminococcus sp.]